MNKSVQQNCLSFNITDNLGECDYNETIIYRNKIIDFNFIALMCIGMPMILIGITTSTMSFIMFILDRFTPKSTKLFLKFLSLVDVIFLVTAVIYLEFKVLYQYYPELINPLCLFRENHIVTIITSLIINYCEMFRNILTVLIGIERYLVTCYPLNVLGKNQYKTAIYGILSCAILTILFRIPITIRLVIANLSDISLHQELYKLSYNIHNIIDSVFLIILPVVILTFCSIKITRALNASKEINSKSNQSVQNTKSQNKRIKVTRMLVIIITIFSICGLPSIVYTILHNFFQSKLKCPKNQFLGRIFLALYWLLSITYSTSNFFVYIIYMPRYRLILRHMLQCHCHKYSSQATPFRMLAPVIRFHNIDHNNNNNDNDGGKNNPNSNTKREPPKMSGILLLEHAFRLRAPDDDDDDDSE